MVARPTEEVRGTAFAVGMSTTFNRGAGVVKAGATFDTKGDGGFNTGAGFGF